MNPVRTLFAVTALVVCAVVAWILLSAPNELDAPSGGQSVAQVDERALANPGDVDNEPTAKSRVEQPNAEGPRLELESGHRVRVVDVEGKPVVGEAVYFYGISPEQIPAYRDAEYTIIWSFPRAASGAIISSRSGDDGIAVLPNAELIIAFVVEETHSGFVLCEPTEDGTPDQVFELALRPRKMVEIIVQDTEGRVVDDGFDLDVSVAVIEEADELADDADGWERDQVWAQDNAIGLLPDGRRMLSLDPGHWATQRLGTELGPLRHRLTFSSQISEPDVREFERDVVGPIVFVLPATGTVRVQLRGAPDGVVPVISGLDSEGQSRGRVSPREVDPEDEWYRFTDIPLNETLGISFRVFYSGLAGRSYIAQLPPIDFAGPTAPGETIDVNCEFPWPSGYRGRFVFPDDPSFDQAACVDELVRASQSCWLDVTAQRSSRESARCMMFPDGSFCIPVRSTSSQRTSTDTILGFSVACRGLAPRPEQLDTWRASRAWAYVEAKLPNSSATVDVGEIVLQTEDPLLRVRVEDPSGEPLPMATVFPMNSTERHYNGRLHRSGREVVTDSLGEAWVIGRDWYQVGGLAPADSKDSIFGAITQLAVKVEHPKYVSTVQEIRVGQREVVVQMAGAGSVAGSVKVMSEIPYCRVMATPSGVEAQYSEHARSAIHMAGRTLEEYKHFEIEQIQPGVWDIVFKTSHPYQRELLRVPGVVVRASEVTEDSRLQQVDLLKEAALCFVRVRDESGRILSAKDLAEAGFDIELRDEAGGASRSTAHVDQGRIVLFADEANSEYQGVTFLSSKYAAVKVEQVEVGEMEISVHEKPEVSIRIGNFDKLPPGSRVNLNGWVSTAGSFEQVTARFDSSEPVAVRLENAGTLGVSASISGPHQSWTSQFQAEQTVEQSVLDQSGEIVVTIPQETLDLIPKQ